MELKKYFKIFLHLKKIGIMNRMAYRVNFFIAIFAVGIQIMFSIVFIKVVFGSVNNMAGWSYYEALVVVATYLMIEGLMWSLFGQFNAIVSHIRQGKLDGLIIKPVDTQFLVSIWRGDPEDLTRVISGIGLITYALSNLNLTLGQIALNLFIYLFLFFNALVITYSLTVLVKTVSFWTVEGSAFFHITDSLSRMSQYPTDIFYHSIVRVLVSSIIPLAFMATVPAKVLARGFDLWLILGSFAVAGVFFVGSRKIFSICPKALFKCE
jgi:ABC-2 type transport system permease protein